MNLKKISIIKKILYILLLLYFVLFLFIYFNQKKFIFFPSDNNLNIPKDMNINEVYFYTKDNIKLHAWYLNNNSKKTVLFFHGNAGNLSQRIHQFQAFNFLKLNALIFDYRGYGKSESSISKEKDLYIDSKAALNYLIEEKNIKEENIILWGRSLGGALALNIAQNRKVDSVIIESSFYSLNTIAKKQFWFLPTKLLLKFKFQNNKKIKNIKSKILIIHSTEDEIINFKNGKKLFELANNPKDFLEIKGHHNDIFSKSTPKYLKKIKEFLNLK